MSGPASGFRWLGDRVSDLVLGRVERRLDDAGRRWLALATAAAPVDTGALRAGLFYRVAGRTLTVGGAAPHTIFVDRGTRHMAGRFFIERALRDVGRVAGGDIAMEFAVPFVASPVLSHQARMIVPSSIQPRPLTRAQHARVASNQAAMRALHRGHVARARTRIRCA